MNTPTQTKPKCKVCNLELDLYTSNHLIGCQLECYAQIIRYRGFEKEANDLDKIAANLK